jgi:thiamine-phosphate pyrophosphorylase
MFDLIVISPETRIENEGGLITSFFEQGLEFYHLRKPEWDEALMGSFIRTISPEFYNRIVIHSHFILAENYSLKGIHLSEINRKLAVNADLKAAGLTEGMQLISSSIHAFEEIPTAKCPFEYMFLSPVFDSISKRDYKSRFDLEFLEQQLHCRNSAKIPGPKIIALGGLSATTIVRANQMGFSGVAVLGAIWESKNPSKAFQDIRNIVSKFN